MSSPSTTSNGTSCLPDEDWSSMLSSVEPVRHSTSLFRKHRVKDLIWKWNKLWRWICGGEYSRLISGGTLSNVSWSLLGYTSESHRWNFWSTWLYLHCYCCLSSFEDNYVVLVGLVYCVTGIGYAFAIFLEPSLAQLLDCVCMDLSVCRSCSGDLR